MVKLARATFRGLSLGILLSGSVNADEGARPLSTPDSTAISSPPTGELRPGTKSGKTALLFSVLGTVVPAAATLPFIWERSGTSLAHTSALVGAGAYLIGPSLGHFYANRPGRAVGGIAIRALAAAGVAIAGLGGASEGGITPGQAALGVAGGIIGAASVVWDIASAPHSARVHNDELRQERAAIGMMLSADSRGIGLSANVTF